MISTCLTTIKRKLLAGEAIIWETVTRLHQFHEVPIETIEASGVLPNIPLSQLGER